MIIRPFLYDFKRTITSKTVLILVAIVLLISLTIIPLTSLRSTGGTTPPQAPILYYQDGVSPNLGYHYLTYFTNQYGDGISGVPLPSLSKDQPTTRALLLRIHRAWRLSR
jgi:hypothetical protein